MNKLYNYFKKLNEDNKISQAFLIGNVSFDEIKEELYNIFKDFILKNNNNNVLNNPDIYIFNSADGIVSKDNIKELLSNLSTTSQFNNKKIYVIDSCELLNDFAYNALLKTLEEPQSEIYAFLITNNIDSVKPTIVSRCQKIFISSNSSKNILNENYYNISNELIESIEKNNIKTIAVKHELYSIIEDRNTMIEILQYVLVKYKDTLNSLINNQDPKNIISNNNDINSISKKLLIINENINRLNNYLNKNLSIDRFIIEMWRCNL